MSRDKLVTMANQIGQFFARQGEERAVAGIADHLRKFWDPRMRTQIYAHLEAGGQGLDGIVLKTIKHLQETDRIA